MLQIKGINDKKSQEEKIYYLIVFAFILFIFVLGLKNLGLQQRIRVIDDEFGYWGIAAHLAGYDWSDLLSRTTYYSFGYSFLLIPLWWLFKCGFGVASIYQIAVVMNVCMHAGSFLIALVVAKKLFPNTNRFYRLMACMISSFYYAYISQTGKAWTEVYLMFMYWCVVLCMIQVLEKRTILWYFLLILATANIFAIHMRALGVVAAVVGVCLLRAILVKDRNWKKAISVCAIAGIILIGVVFMRNYTKDIIYASNPSLAINDFSGQVSNVQHIASSVLAIVDLALSMAGKIYYLGIATFGSVILGVLFICEENISTFWRIVKTKKIEVENRQWVLLMVLVSTAGTVAIDAVYKCWKYISTGSTYTLADTIIYGRYVDFIVGLLVLYCILRVCEKKIWVRQGVIAVIILFICTLITQNLWDILIFYNGEGMSLRNTAVPGISYLLDGSVDGFAYKGFAWACIGAAVFLLFTASQNEKYKNLGMVTIVSIVCISGFILADQHIAEDVWGKAHKEKTVESIVDIVRKSEIEEINYITDSNSVHGDLKILQWCLPEYTINVINPKEIEEFKDNALYLTEGAYVRQVASMDKIMNYVYDSGELAVFCTSDNKDLQKIIDLSHEAATTINPRVMDIELSTAVAEYAYQKVNGSIYLSNQRAEAYLTEKTGLILTDGIYEFIILMESNYYEGADSVGYITITDAKGQYLDTRILMPDDFNDNGKGEIVVTMPVQDYIEPIIGVYTYGNSAMKVNSMSCRRVCGNLTVECERSTEWEEIISCLNQLELKGQKVWYVDSDGSAQSGFPDFRNVNEVLVNSIEGYVLGATLPYRSDLTQDYLIMERTGNYQEYLTGLGQEDVLLETQNYIVVTNVEEK